MPVEPRRWSRPGEVHQPTVVEATAQVRATDTQLARERRIGHPHLSSLVAALAAGQSSCHGGIGMSRNNARRRVDLPPDSPQLDAGDDDHGGHGERTWDDALAAVLGYACGTRTLTLAERAPLAHQVVDVPASAYRAYDCVPGFPEDGFSWLGVLVVDALNGGMDHKAITALKHAADRAWPHVQQAVVQADGTPFKVALTHKLLHHKRPDLFPLIDRQTGPLLDKQVQGDDDGCWAAIHRELAANAEQFAALEATFACLLDSPGDVPLRRLRVHDILLWLIATGNWDGTVAQGQRTAECVGADD